MPHYQTNAERTSQYRAVRRVLWAVMGANLLVTIVKITLGLLTGALAVVADGFHSLVDTSSNLIGLAAIRLANRPADEHHPYGYRRYETIGTLAIGGLLIIAAYEIIGAMIERLTAGAEPELSALTLGLVALTFPVNVVIYTLERRAGRRLNSPILLADAQHTRADLFVTGSVIVSLLGVWWGLPWLDLVTAGGVVILIIRAAYNILKESAGWLTDAVVIEPDVIEEVAMHVNGVQFVHRIRSRGTPDSAFIDLHIKVNPGMSTEQAHAIASEVEHQLRSQIKGTADALVHVEPALFPSTSRWERIAFDLRQIADGMGLGLHDLHIHSDTDESYVVELHLEMNGDISLKEAHSLADTFEERVKLHASRPVRLITHLEPLVDQVFETDKEIDLTLQQAIHKHVEDLVGPGLLETHLRRYGNHISAAIKMSFPENASLSEAHLKAEDIERVLLSRVPEIYRVTVHVEPEEVRQVERQRSKL